MRDLRRRLVSPALVVGIVIGSAASLAPPALSSDDVVRASVSYADANRALGGQVLLWSPTYTAGLSRTREIDVLAYRSGSRRATFVGSSYGGRVPSFTIAQKASASPWAAEPVQRASERLVATVAIKIGPPGGQRPVRARVYANCNQADGERVKRCEPRDVARFGGALVLLARTTSGGVPQATDVRIDSTGLSYQQLLRVARGLRPAA